MAIADFQAQKKTFKDVFFRAFGGRGKLNWLSKLLIFSVNRDFYILLEYQLEYFT